MASRLRLALLIALAAAGLTAGLFVPGGGATSQATIHVTVTATDSKFTLSKGSAPVGTVIFTVKNRGKRPHNFKIAGKKTRLLAARQSATLRVTFSESGRYAYRSTVSGQAAAGMRGTFSVRAATVTTVGTANTTVDVEIYDPPKEFVLTPPTFPSGMVTFVITNHCVFLPNVCSFDIVGVHAGAHLNGGESETWTVALAPGVYYYHCDLAPGEMNGKFTVTP